MLAAVPVKVPGSAAELCNEDQSKRHGKRERNIGDSAGVEYGSAVDQARTVLDTLLPSTDLR